MLDNKILGSNIRKARLIRNYCQDYVAYKLGISQNGYSKIELGYTALTVERLFNIAKILEADVNKLITEPDIKADLETVNSIPVGKQLLEVICRVTGMGLAVIARVTEDRWVACSALDNISFGLESGAELNINTTICNTIRKSGKAVIINDITEDPEYASHPIPEMYGFKSYISVPILRQDGSFFGTLCAIDPKPANINNPETIGMFELFAQLISFYIDTIEKQAFTPQYEPDEGTKRLLSNQLSAILGPELPQAVHSALNVSTTASTIY